MKRLASIVVILLVSVGSSFAKLYAPPDDWLVKGPGGSYGVFSFHTQYSFIVIGPFNLEVHQGFHGTRTAFQYGVAGFIVLALCFLKKGRLRFGASIVAELVLIWIAWQIVAGYATVNREQTATAQLAVHENPSPANTAILAHCRKVDMRIGVCAVGAALALIILNAIGVVRMGQRIRNKANDGPKVAHAIPRAEESSVKISGEL